jgi:hypothetical protein
MAKKLLNNYVFTPGSANSGTIVIDGNHPLHRLLVITNTSIGTIIYNFADQTKGGSVSYNQIENKTTITLEYDTSSMNSADKLQIFVDVEHQQIELSETFIDPVSKIRVSNPENLIDTDFEYGLQSSKWETLELVNNIPSFYASQNDVALPNITSVTSKSGSKIITVTTADIHGLSVGIPVDVRGLASQTAEGKYIITKVPSTTTFTYIARSIQAETKELSGSYTVITPGQFYQGSQIAINAAKGIESDNQSISTLSVDTDYVHGLSAGTSLYLTNTIAAKTVNLTNTTSSTAGDGRPYVDFSETVSANATLDSSRIETRQMTGAYAFKFNASSVNLGSSKILWTNNNLLPGACVLYSPPAGDTAIGGLQRLQIYYVKTADSTGITLCETTGGNYGSNAQITFSSQGTYNYGRGQLLICYEIAYVQKNNYDYYTYFYHRQSQTGGSLSGYDIQNQFGYTNASNTGRAGYWGLGQVEPDRYMVVRKNGTSFSYGIFNNIYYSTAINANFNLGKSSSTPDGYDFIEDFSRFDNGYNHTGSSGLVGRNSQYYFSFYNVGDYYTSSGEASYPGSGTPANIFIVPLLFDQEADSFYAQNHGLSTGNPITITTASGSNIQTQTAATSYTETPTFSTLSSPFTGTVTKLSNDRFRITSSTNRIRIANGTYTAALNLPNPTANTLYLPNHGFSTGEQVEIYAGPSGIMPSTTGGALAPVVEGSTLTSIYSIVKSTLDSVKSTIGSDYGRLLYNSGSAYYPFANPYNQVFLGTGYGYQNIEFYYQYDYVTLYNSGGGSMGSYASNLTTNNSWANGTVYDVHTSTALKGKGFNIITNPWANNTYTDYHIMIQEIPSPASLGAAYIERFYSNSSAYRYNYYYGWNDSNNTNTRGSWTTLTDGWSYTWDGSYHRPTPSSSIFYACGMFVFSMIIDNNNWTGYTSNNSFNIYNSNYGVNYYTGGYGGSRYQIYGMIPLKNGIDDGNTKFGLTTGSVTSIQSIVQAIATNIKNTLTLPSFNVSGITTAEVISTNDNRISFRSADSNKKTYDISNSGTSPLVVKAKSILGTLDGYYNLTSVGSTQFSIGLDYQVPTRYLNFTSANIVDISGVVYLKLDSHGLNAGQKVVYNETNSSQKIPGLTSGTNYYAIPFDENYLKLAETYQYAIDKNAVGIATTSSGSFNLSSNSISGSAIGAGIVNVTSDSNLVSGDTNTLFKRYFKEGDTFVLKNGSSTPAALSSYEISSILSDSKLYLNRPVGFTSSSTNYFVSTKAYVRADGTFQHRPFDGGVEITCGNSPNSSIVRQTRKYFRYQSGKGIQCSVAINFNPSRLAESIFGSGTTATVTTFYAHGLTTSSSVTIKGSADPAYNGTFTITSVTDFTFTYETNTTPSTSLPGGIIEYAVSTWTNSVVRAGMYDYQNGFYFEYDGSTLYAVRRSSVQQIPGRSQVTKNSNIVYGTGTNYTGTLSANSYIVIRGQSYKITSIISNTELHIQPAYRGVSSNNVIITKTVNTRVPQSEWNIDICDGNGSTGYFMDKTKIQMAYMDYSWYGAGKIRFGFKDTYGRVKYVHEFIHNNKLTEAYMRSGNIPARYEVENIGTPTYVPSIFHWGTSVIMDGKFDDDKAYQFTAGSNTLSYTNGQVNSATTSASSSLRTVYNQSTRLIDWYVSIPFTTATSPKLTTGTPLYATGTGLNGQKIAYTQFDSGAVNALIYITSSYNSPASYPVVPSGSTVYIGAAQGTNSSESDLLIDNIPLISIRLAPSVDNNLAGSLGAREIVNRMQLQLKELGISLTHDCEVNLILNGSLSTKNYTSVAQPSLSQLIKHNKGDVIVGGTVLYSLRASGGNATSSTEKRSSLSSNFDLSNITDLGNSINGGDGVFPNGPDIITVAIKPTNTSSITSSQPLETTARITWTESQA